MYRSVGINRTGVTTICQIRDDVPDSIRGVEWVCFGSTTFSAMLPIYTNVHKLPVYLSKVAKDVSTDNLFWSSRLIGTMADHDYPACVQHIERYQNAVVTEGRRIVLEYDRKVAEASSSATDGETAVQSAENADTAQHRRTIEQLLEEANEKLCAMAREQTTDVLGKVLRESSLSMKNGFKMSDN